MRIHKSEETDKSMTKQLKTKTKTKRIKKTKKKVNQRLKFEQILPLKKQG